MPAVSTWRKRRLGSYLEELRAGANVTIHEAAELLGLGAAQLSRLENGFGRPTKDQMERLLDCYKASAEQRAEAWRRWTDAAPKERFQYAKAVLPAARPLVEAERDGRKIINVAALGVPGLLQTKAYAYALHAAAGDIVGDIPAEKAVGLKEYRQQRLIGDDPVEVCAYIDEGVLRRTAGMGEVGHEQLIHLIKHRPNVTVLIVPFSSGIYGASSGNITAIEHDEGDWSIYLEYTGGGTWIEDAKTVRNFLNLIESVRDSTLSVEDSRDLILRVARTNSK